MENKEVIDCFLKHRKFFIKRARVMLKDQDDADDVVQCLYESLIRSRSENIENPFAYVFVMTKNACNNFHRNENRRLIRYEEFGRRQPTVSTELDDNDDLEHLKAVFQSVMARVSPLHRKIFEMSRDQYMPLNLIAEKLGMKEQTIKNVITLIRGRFREALKPEKQC